MRESFDVNATWIGPVKEMVSVSSGILGLGGRDRGRMLEPAGEGGGRVGRDPGPHEAVRVAGDADGAGGQDVEAVQPSSSVTTSGLAVQCRGRGSRGRAAPG